MPNIAEDTVFCNYLEKVIQPLFWVPSICGTDNGLRNGAAGGAAVQ